MTKPVKKPKIDVPSAREMLSTLGAHIRNLHPEVNPNPKKKHISAAGMTARSVNSAMGIVRTSLQASKLIGRSPKEAVSLLALGPL